VIDLHFHLLPDIDDGPASTSAALGLARRALAAGVRTVVATPHVSAHYPNDPDTIDARVEELRALLSDEGVRLELRSGAEIAATYIPEIEPSQLARMGLGGGEWLLVEPPFAPVAPALQDTVQELQRRGHRVVLAHPERCAVFHRDPDMLASLVRGGVLTSITAGSLVGRFGGVPQRFALRLVREGLVHNVASDAHDLPNRTPGIAAELDQAGLAPLAEWFTEAVPAAILNGQEIPARPQIGLLAAGPARRWRLRR
jgi:protein-tyrosine phosphatase